MKRGFESSLRSYLVELVVYSALVAGYYFLVLHFLGGWLYRLFETNRGLYAALALSLIVAQGVVLEILTRWLLTWLKPRAEEE
jgi:hypothetical protein